VRRIVLDLSGLDYVASVAVAAVAAGACRTDADGDRVRLAALAPRVLTLLANSRLSDCVRAYPSVAAAAEPGPGPKGSLGPGSWEADDPGRSGRREGRSVRIPVTFDDDGPIMPVPIKKGRGGLIDRPARRAVGKAVVGPGSTRWPEPGA